MKRNALIVNTKTLFDQYKILQKNFVLNEKNLYNHHETRVDLTER